MVTTQDVSFGSMWTKLIGKSARWAPGDDTVAPLTADPSGVIGMGLVSVWTAEGGPVLVCHPNKGMRALKGFAAGTPVEELRRALREAGAVVREDAEPRRDSVVE